MEQKVKKGCITPRLPQTDQSCSAVVESQRYKMIKLMKLLMISYLLTVLSGCCHGQSNNCPTPSFKNAEKFTSPNCYLYGSPQQVNIGDKVIMRPIVTGSNLTLIWTKTFNGETKVIDKNNEYFFLKRNNMTLTWLYAEKGAKILFKVTATNHCGQATGCFQLNSCVQNCNFNPPVPNNITAITQAINETQNLPLKATTISADPMFSDLFGWCFVEANNNNTVCCTCDGQCSQSDWMIAKQTDVCGCKYSCALTINSTSMKYNGGTFLTKVFFGENATFDITHILVQPKKSSHSLNSMYYVIGSGVGVIVVVFLTLGVVCNIKERGRCFSKKHVGIMHPVEHLTSSTEVEEIQPILEVEPHTSDLYPPTSASYGSTEEHRSV